MCRWKRIGKYKKGSRSLGFKGSREKRGIEAHLGYWSDGEMLVVYNIQYFISPTIQKINKTRMHPKHFVTTAHN